MASWFGVFILFGCCSWSSVVVVGVVVVVVGVVVVVVG